MIENFAIVVIGLSFLAIPMLAFKIVYDDIKRDKKQIKGGLNGICALFRFGYVPSIRFYCALAS